MIKSDQDRLPSRSSPGALQDPVQSTRKPNCMKDDDKSNPEQCPMGNLASLDRVAELSDTENAAVRALSFAVYPPEQWADWPGRHLEWAAGKWCVRVRDHGGVLASHTGVVLRQATTAAQDDFLGAILMALTASEQRHGLSTLAPPP